MTFETIKIAIKVFGIPVKINFTDKAIQRALAELLSKIKSDDIVAFINGTFTGTFPTVKLSVKNFVIPFYVTMTDKSIKQMLTDIKTKNTANMIQQAISAIMNGSLDSI